MVAFIIEEYHLQLYLQIFLQPSLPLEHFAIQNTGGVLQVHDWKCIYFLSKLIIRELKAAKLYSNLINQKHSLLIDHESQFSTLMKNIIAKLHFFL